MIKNNLHTQIFLFVMTVLFLKSLNADVSITINATKSVSAQGEANSLFVTASSPGGDGVTQIVVNIPLPSDVTYNSQSGSGTYNDVTGDWVLNAGNGTIQINITHNANASLGDTNIEATVTSITPGSVSGVGISKTVNVFVGIVTVDWSSVTVAVTSIDDSTYTQDFRLQGQSVEASVTDIGTGSGQVGKLIDALIGHMFRVDAFGRPSVNILDGYGNPSTLFPPDRNEITFTFDASIFPFTTRNLVFALYDLDRSIGANFHEAAIVFGLDSLGNVVFPFVTVSSDTLLVEVSSTPSVLYGTAENVPIVTPAARATYEFGNQEISSVIVRHFFHALTPMSGGRGMFFSNFYIKSKNFITIDSELKYKVTSTSQGSCNININ